MKMSKYFTSDMNSINPSSFDSFDDVEWNRLVEAELWRGDSTTLRRGASPLGSANLKLEDDVDDFESSEKLKPLSCEFGSWSSNGSRDLILDNWRTAANCKKHKNNLIIHKNNILIMTNTVL